MHGIKHPLTGEVYEVERGPDGGPCVVVTTPSGATGTFTMDGRYVSGELKVADAHLCGWMASARGASRFRGDDE